MYFGYLNPFDVLRKLTSKEIALWQAYDNLFPFGQQHTDRLIAQLTAVCFNMWKGKDTEPITVNEVLGIFEPLTEEYVTATLGSFKHGTN